MPETNAKSGFNTLLQHNQSGSYATVAEVLNFSDVGPERTTIDCSNLTSPGDYEEVILGMMKNPEISMKANFLAADATQRGMIAARDNGTKLGWKIIWPDGTTWTFNGYVLKFAPAVTGVNNKIEASVKIKPTGPFVNPT